MLIKFDIGNTTENDSLPMYDFFLRNGTKNYINYFSKMIENSKITI